MSKTMTVAVMTITPQMAIELLRHNTGNRAIRARAVNQYAEDLRRGNWRLTHQGVAISPSGRLLDGQHRLSAIIEAGIAAEMVVARNVAEESYIMMDRGKPRLLADALHQDRRIVDACAYICRLHGASSVEPHHAHEVLAECGSAISSVVAACGHAAKGRSAAPIKAAVALHLMEWHRPNYQALITEQWRAFVLSDFDLMAPSVKALYRQIADNPQSSGDRKRQNDRAARAWIAFHPERPNLGKIQIRDIETPLNEMRAVWRPSWARQA